MCLVILLVLMLASPVDAAVLFEEPEISVQGKLQISDGKATMLDEKGKATAVESDSADLAATLGDERLSGRHVKLLGHLRRDKTFVVRELNVVRGDSLYRIIYFCDRCHITTFVPGTCTCCQEPMVPTEVLPTDPRIYHDEVKGSQPVPGPR